MSDKLSIYPAVPIFLNYQIGEKWYFCNY